MTTETLLYDSSYAGARRKNVVGKVVGQGLCIGCGTCVPMCPTGALVITEDRREASYRPAVDEEKCDECGICLIVCPGLGLDFKKLNLSVFGKEPPNTIIGNHLSCYAGHATDKDVRRDSASGGLVTTLITFALQGGVIDAAMVTRMNMNRPLEPQPFIADSVSEVVSAASSKYCPVPANVALKEVLNKDRRYVVVGLPCQIEGVRKAEMLNKRVRDRIQYCFGLVCGHTPSFNATKYLLRKMAIHPRTIAKLEYRAKGWPGGMNVILRSSAESYIPHFSPCYWGMVFPRFFWQHRCMVCEDKLCELADISFMDAWLPEFSSDRLGTSLIVVRSQRGDELVRKAIEAGVVELQPIGASKIIQAMGMEEVIRKEAARRFILELFGRSSPVYNSSPYRRATTHANYVDLLEALHFTLSNSLSKESSRISDFLVDFHVGLWNLGRAVKHLRGSFRGA